MMRYIGQTFAHRISDPPPCKLQTPTTDKRVALKCDERKPTQHQDIEGSQLRKKKAQKPSIHPS